MTQINKAKNQLPGCGSSSFKSLVCVKLKELDSTFIIMQPIVYFHKEILSNDVTSILASVPLASVIKCNL